MDVEKELVGASTSLLVLGLLAHEASYGYEIIRRANEASGGMFEWREGTLYPVLHKLEREGLVKGKWQEADSGRRRKYYYITAGGRGALERGARRWATFHEMVMRVVNSSSVGAAAR
jgi:DNA-binding PadR family transcriptional regulator